MWWGNGRIREGETKAKPRERGGSLEKLDDPLGLLRDLGRLGELDNNLKRLGIVAYRTSNGICCTQ
jgi:hypothetical protein